MDMVTVTRPNAPSLLVPQALLRLVTNPFLALHSGAFHLLAHRCMECDGTCGNRFELVTTRNQIFRYLPAHKPRFYVIPFGKLVSPVVGTLEFAMDIQPLGSTYINGLVEFEGDVNILEYDMCLYGLGEFFAQTPHAKATNVRGAIEFLPNGMFREVSSTETITYISGIKSVRRLSDERIEPIPQEFLRFFMSLYPEDDFLITDLTRPEPNWFHGFEFLIHGPYWDPRHC